jgi:hypothetical protein
MAICRDCAPSIGCWARENAKIYGIVEYGIVVGELDMMNEIF